MFGQFKVTWELLDGLPGKCLIQVASGKLILPLHPTSQLGENFQHDLGQRSSMDGFQRGVGKEKAGKLLGGRLENREVRVV